MIRFFKDLISKRDILQIPLQEDTPVSSLDKWVTPPTWACRHGWGWARRTVARKTVQKRQICHELTRCMAQYHLIHIDSNIYGHNNIRQFSSTLIFLFKSAVCLLESMVKRRSTRCQEKLECTTGGVASDQWTEVMKMNCEKTSICMQTYKVSCASEYLYPARP